MKRYIKYLLVLSAGLFVMSCNQKGEEYTWGEPDAEDGKVEVFFAKSGEAIELDPADEFITVTVNRKDATGDLSVPIVAKWNQNGVFDVPETVEFADGSATATIDIGVKSALVGEEYTLEIGLPEDNYYIYKPLGVAGAVSYKCTIQKLKWTDLFTGTYMCNFKYQSVRYGQDLPATLQKCESVEGRYRIKDATGPGYHVVMNIVGDLKTDKNGDKYYNFTVPLSPSGIAFMVPISMYDVSSWQGNAAYADYNVLYPEVGYVDIWMAYRYSGGVLAYDDDYFIAD
ncbi:MAG: hypothetical protein IJV01_05650 [Bacteroidales bacterium]|nr:hypothetical protein [Bacteroidales bacterium]